MALNKSRSTRPVLLLCASAMMASGFLTTASAQSSEEAVKFDLPAQSLEQALKSFSVSADKQLMFSTDLAEGKTVAGLSGEMEPMQALDVLLDGTGLVYETTSSNVILVKDADADQRGASDSKNLDSPTPVLMAQNPTNPTQTTSSRSEEGEKRETQVGDSERDTRGQIETIVVIGTRNVGVRRYEDDAQPYVIFGSEEIERSFSTNLEDFLRSRLPQNAVEVPNALDASGGQTIGNQSEVNLRGLGADQTLILVNGRRLPRRALSLDSEQADINGIPLSSIERIEVLPATASGIYGGGATGGAINIILKRQYSGAEIVVDYDNTFDTDSGRFSIEGSTGFTLEDGRTSILLSGAYSDSNSLVEADRGFARDSRQQLLNNNPDAFFDAFTVNGLTPNVRSFGGDLVLDDGTELGSPIAFVPLGYSGFAGDGGSAFIGTAGLYNIDLPGGPFGLQNSLVNNPTTYSYSALVRREFAPWLEGYIDYSRYVNEGNFDRGFQGTFALLDGDAPNNPFQNTIFVNILNPDTSRSIPATSETDTFQFAAGFDLSLPFDWKMQIEYSLGESETLSTSFVPALMDSFRDEVEGGTIDVLRDLNQFPIDIDRFLFSEPTTVSGPLTTAQDIWSIRATGPSLVLPAGPVRISTLVERRVEDRPVSFSTLGRGTDDQLVLFNPGSDQTTTSAYVEALIPIFSREKSSTLLNELELQLAVRHDDYKQTFPEGGQGRLSSRDDDPGNVAFRETSLSSTDLTVGLRYKPTQDILVRTSFATGFLPPRLANLASSNVRVLDFPSGFHDLADPKRGAVGGNNVLPIEVVSSGNPDLRPEESESYSFGIVLTPKFIDGFRISADYIRIEKTDEVILPTAEQILEFEDQLIGRVVRAPLSPEDIALGFTGGQIIGLDQSFLNFATTDIEAYDFQVNYDRGFAKGELSIYAVATYQTSLSNQLLPSSPVIDSVGFSGGPLQWRGNFGVTWNADWYSIGWNGQFYDSYRPYGAGDSESVVEQATINQGSHEIPNQSYHDVYARFNLGRFPGVRNGMLEGFDVTLGIQNVFNERPPIISTRVVNSGGYSTYGDPRLRRYSIQLRKQF